MENRVIYLSKESFNLCIYPPDHVHFNMCIEMHPDASVRLY